jgi:S-ribosylhomocysteine lyase LuxS involved in autoinducer biosynthesis
VADAQQVASLMKEFLREDLTVADKDKIGEEIEKFIFPNTKGGLEEAKRLARKIGIDRNIQNLEDFNES